MSDRHPASVRDQPVGRRAWLVLTAAFGLLVVLLIYWSWRSSSLPSDMAAQSGVRQLAVALGPAGAHVGRLVGGFAPAASTDTTLRGADVDRTLPVEARLASLRIEQAVGGEDSARADAALGVVRLVGGDSRQAILRLESATARAPDDAAAWSNLASAYLTAAQRLEQDELWVRALAAAERARMRRPNMLEPLFNRALSLEKLGLFDEASRAWTHYLSRDSSSAWAKEARAHRTSTATQSSPIVQWTAFRDAHFRASDPALRTADQSSSIEVTAKKAAPFRQYLREWIERELLPAWAGLVLRGNAGVASVGADAADAGAVDAALRRAREAAEILRLAGGDVMPAQGIAAIDGALRSAARDRDALIRDLAEGHLGYLNVVQLFDEGRVAEAAAGFERIEPKLARADSAYARWGVVYKSVALYAARLPDEARALLTKDTEGDDTRGLRYLRGRRQWLEGLIDLNGGRFEAALGYYQRAFDDLEAVGELDGAAAVAALLGENLASLGLRREGWRYQREALERAAFLSVPRRKHLIFQTGGLMCLNEALPEAALAFQDAVLRIGEQANNRPATLVEGYLHRARIHQRIGDMVAAARDLTRATSLVPSIVEDTLRRREEAEVLAATAEIAGTTAPDEAIAAASRALDHFGDVAGGFPSVRLHLARGRAFLARGSVSAAERDFAKAIEHFESQRRQVRERQYRQTLFEYGWNAYAEMVRLQVLTRRDAASGLDYAERARARSLLEVAMGADDAAPLSVAEMRPHLPSNAAVLFFAVLPDRLVTWSITRDGITLAERPVNALALTRAVADARRLLEGNRTRPDPQTGILLHELYGMLVAPFADVVARHSTLVIVPDGALHALPFNALIDPATGRHLIETHVVAVAPSLNMLVRAFARPPRADGARAALVVGSPAHQAITGASLPELPFAREETLAIASVYGNAARLLMDTSATIGAMLSGLPAVDIVHYAGHALVDPESPERSRLLLAPAGGRDDGVLYARALSGMSLPRHPVVVLAACSTHVGNIAAGEGVQSIARPFLEAGASSVVATLWDVQDRAASDLFRRFHQKLAAGIPPAEALAETQREALRATDPDARAPSRWAWAVAIGGITNPGPTLR